MFFAMDKVRRSRVPEHRSYSVRKDSEGVVVFVGRNEKSRIGVLFWARDVAGFEDLRPDQTVLVRISPKYLELV